MLAERRQGKEGKITVEFDAVVYPQLKKIHTAPLAVNGFVLTTKANSHLLLANCRPIPTKGSHGTARLAMQALDIKGKQEA